MNANELRIGNLVNKSLKSGSGKTVVAPIGCQSIVRIFENTGSFNYEPIPLSAEWFDKFSFKKRIDPDGYLGRFPGNEKSVFEHQYTKEGIIISEYHFQGQQIRYEFIYPNSEPNIYSTLKLDYVHQLQNLFFDLKGEELTVKKNRLYTKSDFIRDNPSANLENMANEFRNAYDLNFVGGFKRK